METIEIESVEGMARFAERAVSLLSGSDTARVLALSGELGAGKTTFVQQLARVLGVENVVASPTFLVMKQYGIPHHPHFSQLVHIDAYRIDDEKELSVLRLEELLKDPKNIIAIEWAEKIPSFIPNDALHIEIAHSGDNSRTITYGKKD